MTQAIGRTHEIAALNKYYKSNKAEFVAVYGRRRVGKTFIIRNTLEQHFTFYFSGVIKVKQAQHLANFNEKLLAYSQGIVTDKVPENWFEAFKQLETYLKQCKQQKKVIFIDELPWLDTPKSDFVPALDYFWNSWASTRKDMLLIVCGSAASWMINTLLNDKGGLHNRLTQRIKLQPFTLLECEAFFKQKGSFYTRYQLIQLYMAFGGIPFYLDQIDVSQSVAQNIDNLCFTQTGLLRTEFKNLYASLFKKSEKYVAIIEALATKLKGLSRAELIALTKLTNGGNTTKILKELEENDFIRTYNSFDKLGRDKTYQLIDFYSLFYLRFIKNSILTDTNYWLNNLDNPSLRAWSGYAFEQVGLWHLDNIKKALGISGIQTKTSAWSTQHKPINAQIDLVIDRRDQVINLCEMKFGIDEYIITKDYAAVIKNKIAAFKETTKTKKAICFTMLTSFGLKQNGYTDMLVQKSLTMDVFFEKV